MESHGSHSQHVELSLKDYNQLYEKAYLNEKTEALEKDRRAWEEERKAQEEALQKKIKNLEDIRVQREQQREREQRGVVTSQNWLLLKHSVSGYYDPSSASQDSGVAEIKCTLEFSVFDKEWTVIPLVDSQIITSGWCVERAAPLKVSEGATDPHWESVPLTSETVLHVQDLDGGLERQVLATNTAGLYRVSFKAFIFVHCKRNLSSLSINLVHPFTAFHFQLKRRSWELVREFSCNPFAQYEEEETDDGTIFAIRLPSTKSVDMKWRLIEESVRAEWEHMNQDGAADNAVDEEPMQVIATHDALHTIMDGVLQSSHTLKYSVDSDQRALSSVRFVVQGPARVTSVAGHGVKSWKACPASSKDAAGETSTAVEVCFKSSLISDSIIVILNTELELNADVFSVPNVVCDFVLRQTGSFGIVKLANVEVHEHAAKGMARVSAEELPEHLRYQTNRPIMFAYKYLSTSSTAELKVVKHEQVDVLDAVAECAFYEVLVSEGQSMHRLMLNMQNSRKQYLQLHGIPLNARLWSLMVNSKPAKPVRGKDGDLLIPLLVGIGGSSNEGAHTSSVEITYLVQRDPLGTSGTLDLAPPRLDVAISRLQMEVQWPTSHNAKFKGTAHAVTNFSHAKPKSVNHDVGTDLVAASFDFNKLPANVPKAGVNVHVPRSGDCHRFEQLLVVDGGASLAVEYLLNAKTEPERPRGLLASLQERLCCRRR